MTQFEDREKAFENKYKHDEALRFKVMARRNKLLGLWAAEKLGLTGSDAESYAKDVVAADFDKPGDEDVLQKVSEDLKAKGVAVSDHAVRQEMDRLLTASREHFKSQL